MTARIRHPARSPRTSRTLRAPALVAQALPEPVGPDPDVEALLRATLDGLSAHVAVLDRSGTIIAVNKAWRAFAEESGYAGADHGVGANYLAVCEAGAAACSDAARTAAALRDILAGERREFRMEYPCVAPGGSRWFQLRITRAERPPIQRIVVAHEDITEIKQAHEELAKLTGRLMQLQDQERRSLARELHDTTAQNLLAVTLNVSRARERVRAGAVPNDRLLSETLELAEQSLQEVRTLSYLLHPPLLDLVGLGPALRWIAEGFAERSGIRLETAVEDGTEQLSQDAATALFRVAQECLANVHRHSGSKWARLALACRPNRVDLEVLDAGKGFDTKVRRGHATVGVGLSGMRLRLEQLGGQLKIESGPSGTRVLAVVPVEAAASRS